MPGPHYLAGGRKHYIDPEPEADGGREVAAAGGGWVGGRGANRRQHWVKVSGGRRVGSVKVVCRMEVAGEEREEEKERR